MEIQTVISKIIEDDCYDVKTTNSKYFHLFKWQIFTKDDQILLSPLLVDWHYLIKSQSCELGVCQSICWSSFEYSHFDVTYNYALEWWIYLHKYLIRFLALSWWVLEHFLAENSPWHFTFLLAHFCTISANKKINCSSGCQVSQTDRKQNSQNRNSRHKTAMLQPEATYVGKTEPTQ